MSSPPVIEAQRAPALLALIVAVTVTYIGVLVTFDLLGTSRERRLGSGLGPVSGLGIFIDPVSVDPVADEMDVRIRFTPTSALLGNGPDTANRELTLINSDWVERRVLRANQQLAPATIKVDLNGGSIADYPFDRYRADIRFQAFEGTADRPGAPVPEQVTVWESLHGYRVQSADSAPTLPGDVGVVIYLRRTDAVIFFALAAYLAMGVMACSALTVASLTFLGRRKVEATLMSALSALVFALPALRNALPGEPPHGVRADVAVFLWSELAAVLALALFVFSWARQRT